MYTKTTTRFKSLVNKIYDASKRATFQCSLEREKTETDLFNEPLKKINSITPGPKTSHIFFSHQFKHSPHVTGNRKNHYITIHIILFLRNTKHYEECAKQNYTLTTSISHVSKRANLTIRATDFANPFIPRLPSRGHVPLL